tara:strand:- start:140 stop:553 length:414 start_codon:yes stop_codon:yes gene_type:complete
MIVEIISGLWIGDLNEFSNTQFMNDNLISVILNCTLSHQVSSIDKRQHIRIPVSDLNEPSSDFVLLKQNLGKIIHFIHTNIDEKNICILGYNNFTIPLIICAVYIMKFGDIKKEMIMTILQSKYSQFTLDHDISFFL